MTKENVAKNIFFMVAANFFAKTEIINPYSKLFIARNFANIKLSFTTSSIMKKIRDQIILTSAC